MRELLDAHGNLDDDNDSHHPFSATANLRRDTVKAWDGALHMPFLRNTSHLEDGADIPNLHERHDAISAKILSCKRNFMDSIEK